MNNYCGECGAPLLGRDVCICGHSNFKPLGLPTTTDLLNPPKPAPTTIGDFKMTDNDKATASEVSGSDMAREAFEDYMVIIHHCTEDHLSVDPENDDRYFDCNIDLVWSAWQHQQDIIESLLRTIEEKDREIAKHENDAKYRQGVMASQAESIEQLQARVKELDREIDIMRLYGNKDCTAMADEAIKKIREPKP